MGIGVKLMLDRKNRYGRFALTFAVGLVAFALAFLSACATDQDPQESAKEAAKPSAPLIQIVTTTNFVADWARVVGGNRVEVFSLLPVGGDPHHFQPTPRDIARVADADLVLAVGLYLEAAWLEELLHNASADESKIVALGEGVNPIEFSGADMHDDHGDEDDHSEDGHDDNGEEGEHSDDDHEDNGDEGEHSNDDHEDHGDEDDHGDHGHEGHVHGAFDPHFWFDPLRVKIAVYDIAARLAAIDPDNADVYFRNALAYGEELDELHAWIQDQVSAVEPERRLLVTSHDSLSYFAELYGFEVVGLVIPSLSTHVEPSAEHIAELVEVIREHDVPALFGETTVSDRLAQAVARETGAEVVQLYSGSLGPEGSGADTYLGMVRTNVTRIVEALK
ncbi:MAG: zinc ABC transporter substrate-binding protein [Chloroflexi bacterium]|nr:zinc ABC transporter substrate-binding protein [Chloroflexota bacterium]